MQISPFCRPWQVPPGAVPLRPRIVTLATPLSDVSPHFCWFFVQSRIRDKMRPITMQLNYTLTNTAVPVSHEHLEPVLDDYIPPFVIAQVCTVKRNKEIIIIIIFL